MQKRASTLLDYGSHDPGEPVPGLTVGLWQGKYLVASVVIDVEADDVLEEAWDLATMSDLVAGVLDYYGWCEFRSFVLKFWAAVEFFNARPPLKRKRTTLEWIERERADK